MLQPRGRWHSPSGREGRGGAAAGLLCVAPSSWGAGCLCKRVCCCLQKPAVPGEVVTRLLMRREQGDPSQEGTGSERSGVFAGERVACPPRRRAPVSQPCALPSAARQRPTLRPDCSNSQKAHHCLKQRLRLGWGQDLGTLSSRPVSAPVCCPLTSKGTQVALFMALSPPAVLPLVVELAVACGGWGGGYRGQRYLPSGTFKLSVGTGETLRPRVVQPHSLSFPL